MIRIHLPAHEQEQLQRTFRTADDRKLRDRVQIILMAARGRPHQDIAQDLGLTPRSVQRWLNAYLDRGLDGLRPRKPPGAAPRLLPEFAPILCDWVIGGPKAAGLCRANWTYAELAEHLYQRYGLRIRKSALQTFCARHGIRPYRPTYRFLRGNAAKQEKARQELAEQKRGPTTMSSCS
jgi:transposase